MNSFRNLLAFVSHCAHKLKALLFMSGRRASNITDVTARRGNTFKCYSVKSSPHSYKLKAGIIFGLFGVSYEFFQLF